MTPSRRELFRSGLGLLALEMASSAQASQTPQETPSLFQEVVPDPTGRNGYEEFVQAAQLISQNATLEGLSKASLQAVQSDPNNPNRPKTHQPFPITLTRKRALLEVSECTKALALLRQGLRKPILPTSPINIGSPHPEVQAFYRLVQLLVVEQYVLLANGRTRDTVASLNDGLQFCSRIQVATTDTWASEFTLKTIIESFALHLSQLNATDCDVLLHLCLDWLRGPNPAAVVLQLQWKACKEALERVKAKPALLLSWWPDEVGTPEQDLADMADSNPAGFNAEFDRAETFVDTYYNHALEQLNRPAWERTAVFVPDDTSIARRLAYSLCYSDNMNLLLDTFTKSQARVTLLACHAAIRRYLWEFDRLPASLEELHLQDYARDPFTGKPLHYRIQGRDYALGSSGPPARQQNPNAVDGRIPLTLISQP